LYGENELKPEYSGWYGLLPLSDAMKYANVYMDHWSYQLRTITSNRPKIMVCFEKKYIYEKASSANQNPLEQIYYLHQNHSYQQIYEEYHQNGNGRIYAFRSNLVVRTTLPKRFIEQAILGCKNFFGRFYRQHSGYFQTFVE